ncbi:MAG: hypothetical protein AAGI12_08025 [Pseudomonadota bacterium]
MANRPSPITKRQTKELCQGAFDGGATRARIELPNGVVMTAYRDDGEKGGSTPLESWERQHGQS